MSGRELPGDGKLPLRDLIEAGLENSPDATLDLEVLNDELRRLTRPRRRPGWVRQPLPGEPP